MQSKQAKADEKQAVVAEEQKSEVTFTGGFDTSLDAALM